MQKTSQKKIEWERYKEVSVPWAVYDAHRINECKHVLDLRTVLTGLDGSVQRREFKPLNLTVLLLLKILFGVSYRTIASACKDLQIYRLLGMKRAPCYKTIQNTLGYLDESFFIEMNALFHASTVKLAGIDSSGMKTHRKGVWIQIRFQRFSRKRDFKKIHIFVDLYSKKILYCVLTKGTSHDAKQLKNILQQIPWMKYEIILGDKGYDSRECFNAINKQGAIPGIPVRKNATTRSKGSPTRRRSVIAQRNDYEQWKKHVHFTMRCIVECIFSGMKRRFGEYFFSVNEKYRKIEMWLRTILWNVMIYPR
jgi:transposase